MDDVQQVKLLIKIWAIVLIVCVSVNVIMIYNHYQKPSYAEQWAKAWEQDQAEERRISQWLDTIPPCNCTDEIEINAYY